jgi:hypothetical protein
MRPAMGRLQARQFLTAIVKGVLANEKYTRAVYKRV